MRRRDAPPDDRASRQERLDRRKKLGIVPENTKLTAKADIAPDWDTLTADEKTVAIRYQELFAAFAELTDSEIGRVVQAIEDVGVLDNTLIIYVAGDNGASPNGGRLGVFNTMSTFNPGMIGMKENAFIDVKNRSSSITAELESGGAGVIVAQGGAHSGWSLYVKDGRPAFAYNFLGAVTTISSSDYATGENQFTGKIKQVMVSVKADAAKPDAGAIRHIPE